MKILDSLHLFLLTLGLGLCIYYYNVLPAEIPVRFGFDGSPNGYASRSTLFVIYGIWFATAALFAFIERNPQWNTSYAPGLSEAEMKVYRAETSTLLPLVNLLTGALMLVILGQVIYSGLYGQDLSDVFAVALWSYLIVVIGLVIRALRRAKVLAKAQADDGSHRRR